jgi:autotransporter family porin
LRADQELNMTTPLRRALAGVLATASFVGATVLLPSAWADAATTPVRPDRALDTRLGIGAPVGRLNPGVTLALLLGSKVPGGTTAVMLNITATEAPQAGFVTAWPCGEQKPGTSVVNFVANDAAPNAVAMKLTPAGVCFAASSAVHLVVDVMASFSGGADFVGATPNRALDTRITRNPLQAMVERRLQIAGTPGIPTNAQAAALNITVVAPRAAGWVVAYPCGTNPATSNVNFRAGEIMPNLTVVGLTNGDVCLKSLVDTEVVVDSFGWSSNAGDLRVASPQRILDTRDGTGGNPGPASVNQPVRLRVAGRGGVPNSAAAALLTVTIVARGASGYVTAWPCDEARPTASVLNMTPGALRSNLALVKLSATDGEVCLQPYTTDGSYVHLVADVAGWVNGSFNRQPPPVPPVRFGTLPLGAALPSDAACAAAVRRGGGEVRPINNVANATPGTRANTVYPRVTGNFTGTTDEILQWVACKWGIDEDIVRAQVAKESWWRMDGRGDLTSNQANCYPPLRTGGGQCPESVGAMQVRYAYHGSAFVDGNAVNSTAYNLDYSYAVWRDCFDGNLTWLNSAERGATYVAGDVWGCVGVWLAGRWYTDAARTYIAAVQQYQADRVWEQAYFANL